VELPQAARGLGGAGTNHHLAFRVKDEAVLMAFREKIARQGYGITDKIDRNYFYSLYFREPGGVLFEIATENPGFGIDEPWESLGSGLLLPPQYEPHRAQIEAVLPKLD
jgi:glyoxalase family protein